MPRDWLLTFRPETYEGVKAHGTIGVLSSQGTRFAELGPGDRFVAYVSRVQQLDAYGEVTSETFLDNSTIFGAGSGKYVHRARVRFARTGLARNAKQLLYGVSVFQGGLKTTPANLLFCNGGFMTIKPEDYDWLVGCMEGRIKPTWEDDRRRGAKGDESRVVEHGQ